MVAIYRRSGVSGAGLHYATACEQSALARDPRWKIHLLSCSGLFLSPLLALPRVEAAVRLAREKNLAMEVALSQANLGLVHLELGDFAAAKTSLRSALQTLQGGPRAVALNNLAIAVSPTDKAQALRYIASALACAERPHVLVILANQAAFQAEQQPLQLPDFSSLATWAAEECDPPLHERLRFNFVRSLLEEALPEAALREAEAFSIGEEGHRDGALVVAQWARLQKEIYSTLERPYHPSLDSKAALLDRSTERQAWLYRLHWALCPIPLYGKLCAPNGFTED
jgi:hypothetical protein